MTGGYVYRGSQQPSFAGTYVFGDYCSGRIWGLVGGGNGAWRRTQLGQAQGVQISSFGEDETGEVFLTGHGDGTVYRLVTEPR